MISAATWKVNINNLASIKVKTAAEKNEAQTRRREHEHLSKPPVHQVYISYFSTLELSVNQ